MTSNAADTRLVLRISLVAWLFVEAIAPAVCGAAEEQGRASAEALFAQVAAAWSSRDPAVWLALWEFASPDQRAEEEALVRAEHDSDETTLELLGRRRPSPDGVMVGADFRLFTIQEPQSHVAYWRLVAHKFADRWALVARVQESEVDGLVHLSLADEAWHARGAALRLPDFELRMEDGTLYSSPEPLGPTVLVFVGTGRVRVTPEPKAEREQLRQFSGSPTMDRRVDWAYIRINPADFDRLLGGAPLAPEPHPAERAQEAQKVLRERMPRSFAVDAALPRSPWWLMPGLGDTIVDFPWRHHRVLTYALSTAENEDVNLFDRDRRLQICVYASAGHARGGGRRGATRPVAILNQELAVRFEPQRFELTAAHRLTLRPLAPLSTLRLKLDDDLNVSSVSAEDGTSLFFFRVRDQNSIVISLGGLADRGRPFTLVTRYGGRHDPAPIDHELLQVPGVAVDTQFDVVVDKPPLVFSNRTAWYPRLPEEEFATASVSFDTPEGWLGVTGGELVSIRSEGKRTRAQYRLAQPGKFVSAIVGRIEELGLRQQGEQAVRAFATSRARSQASEEAQRAEQILAFYAELFGPCPYPSLNLVVTDAPTPGGHSPPGLVYLQQRAPMLGARSLAEDPANFSDLPDFFLAHELAHQWWGQGAAPAGYRDRWLSEAWAQYAAALWIRHREGEGAFRSMMDRMASWARRDDRLGPISLGQRLGVLQRDQRIFRAVVYDKGAWVIHMLRGVMGDEAFFRATRHFLEQHRYARVETRDLRETFERESGKDLGAYFARWIDDTGLPLVRWSDRREGAAGGFRTTVEAEAEGAPGPLPLDITIETASGRQSHPVLLDPAGGSWTFGTSERPRDVELNEGRTLLGQIKHVRHLKARPQR